MNVPLLIGLGAALLVVLAHIALFLVFMRPSRKERIRGKPNEESRNS